MTLYGFVFHDCFRRMSEHLCHVEVEGAHAVALFEREMLVAGRLAHNVHRGALAHGYFVYVVYVFFVDEQTHAFLRFVCYDFARGKRGVTDREFGHVDKTSAFFNEL